MQRKEETPCNQLLDVTVVLSCRHAGSRTQADPVRYITLHYTLRYLAWPCVCCNPAAGHSNNALDRPGNVLRGRGGDLLGTSHPLTDGMVSLNSIRPTDPHVQKLKPITPPVGESPTPACAPCPKAYIISMTVRFLLLVAVAESSLHRVVLRPLPCVTGCLPSWGLGHGDISVRTVHGPLCSRHACIASGVSRTTPRCVQTYTAR